MTTVDASELYVFAAELANSTGQIGAKGSAALRKVAFDTETHAKLEITRMDAVDTGDMRDSVSTEIRGDGRFGAMEAEIGPTVDYAVYVHDGTSVVAPRRFMERPFSIASDQLAAAYEALAGDIL